MNQRQPTSPFANVRRRMPQFSVRLIFLLTLVFAIGSSILVAALRTPFVSAEIALWTGRPAPSTTGGHYTQLIFLLLCYCSTMLLAMVVQIGMRVNRWFANRTASAPAATNVDPFSDN